MEWMARVESATCDVLSKAGELAWFLRQSLYTHGQRLSTLHLLGVPSRVLDVGAGTGALSLDLAWLLGDSADVIAVDQDERSLELLSEMAGLLGVSGMGSVWGTYRSSRGTALAPISPSLVFFSSICCNRKMR